MMTARAFARWLDKSTVDIDLGFDSDVDPKRQKIHPHIDGEKTSPCKGAVVECDLLCAVQRASEHGFGHSFF